MQYDLSAKQEQRDYYSEIANDIRQQYDQWKDNIGELSKDEKRGIRELIFEQNNINSYEAKLEVYKALRMKSWKRGVLQGMNKRRTKRKENTLSIKLKNKKK